MPFARHQTVKLARGPHSSPRRGVCVMELASMLGGERFSDHPPSVSPVIGAFLRKYNDGIDDIRRQDLYRFASAAVGTRAAPEVEVRRTELALVWARQCGTPRRRGVLRLRLALAGGFAATAEDAGAAAARVALKLVASGQPGAHEAALRFVDQLIGHRDSEEPRPGDRRAQLPTAA
jgi:hypothetical protein